MSNIITSARFGTNIEDMKAAGIEVTLHETEEDRADVKLDEPRYGESYLGDLTDEEQALFVELYRSNIQLEDLTRDYIGASISRLGEMIRSSDRHKQLHEAIASGEAPMDFGSDENKLAFFRLQAKIGFLKANLYWRLGERFNAHDFSIGVRSKFRAYKVQSRV